MDIPTVKESEAIKTAMQVINERGYGIAFVLGAEDHLVGVVTDGDIRRAILSGISLQSPISEMMNTTPIKMYESWSEEQLDEFLRSPEVSNKIPKLGPLIFPVVDEEEKIVRFELAYRDGRRHRPISQAALRELGIPKKILVIGGAGYIGSVLVRMLLAEGFNVKVMDSLIYGDDGIRELYTSEDMQLIVGEVTNLVNIVEAMKDVDAIVHLAAIVGDPAGQTNPKQTLQVNYFSTSVLVDIAKYLGIQRFIFASTCSVYGFKEHKCTEVEPTNPLSLYAETKIMSENVILEKDTEGFCPTILRFATAYGVSPRMRFDLVVNLLVAKATMEGRITVFGQGMQRRPFAHVRDISRAIITVLKAPTDAVCGEIFNVGSEKHNLSIMELAETIKMAIPESTIEKVEEKEDNRSYSVSFDKMEERLGFTPKESMSEAIAEIREYIGQERIEDYKDKKFSNYATLKEQ